MRKEIELDLRATNIRDVFHKGDIIVGAEELGHVVSARMSHSTKGMAMVYFMGGDCERETFGIPQTLTVLRETEREFEACGRPIGTHVMAEISKVGGGQLGRRYTGRWAYRYTQNGRVVAEGDDLNIAKNVTHEEAARIGWTFLDSDYAAQHEDD